MKIPDNTHIQSIDLRVKNLESSLRFYSYLLGFKEIEKKDNYAALSASGNAPYIIKLVEDKKAKYAHRDNTGLYHVAIRLPSRKELARVFLRLFNNKIKFHGFSDHLVSEAIYLADPDENGVELYVDKPRAEWIWRLGEVEMATLPLDLNVITSELNDKDIWNGIHPETEIGHIHLKVSDIFKAEIFYSNTLGFNVTTASYPGALFLSAGGYHHHIGTNIWHSKNGTPPPENSLGLISYTIYIPGKEYLEEIEKSAKESNLFIEKHDGLSIVVKDFDNNKIKLTL
jgi:catechol 2,3-dioxygenase